ncbi:MAG: hypothetical protein HY822_25165 [Acidobacteria bacterium]|nr:hypothetical protein [Acidobacteriota bacterium]
MKNLFLALAMIGLFAAAAFAQEASVVLARVPFDFAVGAAQMPAGVYTLERNTAAGMLTIRDGSGLVKAMIQAIRMENSKADRQPMLVFNTYGGRHFLSRVWWANGPGQQMLRTRIEKELLAATGAKQVLVAGRLH